MKKRKNTSISSTSLREQNMGKENIKIIKKLLLNITSSALFVAILFNAFIILRLHKIVPFFPVLFLFDFCLLVGYPLFLRYVFKKKWFECTKDEYLKIKYLMFPWLIMSLAVLLYYTLNFHLIHKELLKNHNLFVIDCTTLLK